MSEISERNHQQQKNLINMKVKGLIEQLQNHDPDKMVVVAGYEGGHKNRS